MKVNVYSFKPFVFTKLHCNRARKPPGECPYPRSGHRIVCDDGNLYSFGGYNPEGVVDVVGENGVNIEFDGTLFKELWRFNFASKAWDMLSEQDTIPGDELASNAMVLAVNSVLIVYGGTGFPFGINVTNNCYLYNIQKGGNMLLINVTGKKPPKRYGQAIVLFDTSLYTIGGTTGYDYFADVHRLDLTSNKWEEVYICKGYDECEPPGRYRHEVSFDGTRIYMLGGGTSTEVYGFDVIPAFNIQSGKWEKLSSHGDPTAPAPGIPLARRCHGCVSFGNGESQPIEVIISGGYDGDNIYDDVWKLELHTLQWTLISHSRLPCPVYFHSAAVTPYGRMYTFGGIEKDGFEIDRTADVYSAWVTIPELSELCWEAFLHYTSHKKGNFDKRHLYELGIPKHFIQRLRPVKE